MTEYVSNLACLCGVCCIQNTKAQEMIKRIKQKSWMCDQLGEIGVWDWIRSVIAFWSTFYRDCGMTVAYSDLSQFRTCTARCSGPVREKQMGQGLLPKHCHNDVEAKLSADIRLKKYEIEELWPIWVLLVLIP